MKQFTKSHILNIRKFPNCTEQWPKPFYSERRLATVIFMTVAYVAFHWLSRLDTVTIMRLSAISTLSTWDLYTVRNGIGFFCDLRGHHHHHQHYITRKSYNGGYRPEGYQTDRSRAIPIHRVTMISTSSHSILLEALRNTASSVEATQNSASVIISLSERESPI